MTSFSLKRTIIFGYLIALAIICFFAFYTWLNLQQAQSENKAINQTLFSLRVVESVLDDMQNLETGQRGYLISGEKTFLEPYQLALDQLGGDTMNLHQLAVWEKEGKRKGEIDRLLKFIRLKLSNSDITIRAMQDKGIFVENQEATLQGKLYMDSIRSLIQTMENEDRVVLDKHNRSQEGVAKTTSRLFILLAIFFIVFLFSFLWVVRKEVRGRLNNELTTRLNQETIAFRDILDRISDGFTALDHNWNIVYINQAAGKAMGRDDLLGKNLWKEYPDDIGNEFYKAYHHAMDTLEYVFVEGYNAGLDSWFENHIYPSTQGITIHSRNINKRKQTELKLQQTKDRMEAIAKATNDVLWEADLVNGTLWWNDNFYEKFGYTREPGDRQSHQWENYIHPLDKERVVAHVKKSLQDKSQITWVEEYRFLKADGSSLNIYDRSYIMRDKNGQAYRMIGSMADVTSLFETRKELKRTEEQYQTLVEQASDGIFIANQSGKFIMVNSSGCKLSQYSLDELKQLTIYDLADQEELKQTPFRFEEMAGDYGVRSERKLKKKDGTTIDVEVNAKFLSDGRFLAFVRDITERRKAEQEILKAQRLADKLIDSLPGIFYFYDEAGTFIRWNKEFERVTGYSSDQIKEMRPTDFISNEEKDSALNAIDRIFTRGNNDVEANLITRKGLKIPYYFKASKINYEGRQCVVGSAIDISERKKSEDELRLSEQKYKLLFHNNPLPMIMISLPDLNIIDVNEASVTHYGYTREEFLSMPAIALRPPEEVPRFLESIKIKRDGVRYSGTWHHKKKDGTLIDVEVISHDIPYGNKPARLVLINDVTEKNKASAALNESLENIRNLTGHIQNIREEERTHIAREIHDELGQQLTVLKMDVSWLNRRIADSDESIKQKLKELSEMLDGTVKTIRRISSELRPSL
ncbi:MAG TPA: PAS domain S-box protein, partial [Chitinophagaceae bacterium]|nr:PAS domain S-box protein [Chitinophagaceae bacterium]